MESLLEVRDLRVRYRTESGHTVRAVESVSFQIAAGEVVGVLGESGSGKSTLAASLLAMFPLNASVEDGVVLLQGKNLMKLTGEESRRIRGKNISLVYQEPGSALHPTMRIGSQIEEVLRAHTAHGSAERQDAARALLNSVFTSASDVERIYRSYPHQLSGGQRQRVAIAQAIACKPSLLVADEPTASLDPVTQREILELLKKLQRELKLAILFITHNPELLAGFADRVLVMYAGTIVEMGRASEILRSPLHPYTRALRNCRPGLNRTNEISLGSRLPVIPGDTPDLTVPSNGCVFEPRCSERVAICRERVPGVTTVGESAQVRCFKFDVANGI